MNQEAQNARRQTATSSTPSYALPAAIIGVAVLLEASAKSIAKAFASGLQDRANIEGTIAVISILGLVIGIGLLIRTYLVRKKAQGHDAFRA